MGRGGRDREELTFSSALCLTSLLMSTRSFTLLRLLATVAEEAALLRLPALICDKDMASSSWSSVSLPPPLHLEERRTVERRPTEAASTSTSLELLGGRGTVAAVVAAATRGGGGGKTSPSPLEGGAEEEEVKLLRVEWISCAIDFPRDKWPAAVAERG